MSRAGGWLAAVSAAYLALQAWLFATSRDCPGCLDQLAAAVSLGYVLVLALPLLLPTLADFLGVRPLWRPRQCGEN